MATHARWLLRTNDPGHQQGMAAAREGDLPAIADFLRRTDVRVREALGLGGGSGRGATAHLSARPAKTKWVEYKGT